ncbi:MAG: SRPBCC family protein [Bacteroidetes bacterium SW_9_63_38]|nr:MAG: SRPBCC family protein [Bacteroidetes bacterium SW_9_63_38]
MLTVRDHIDIAASVEKAFAYMDAPAHQTDITPSLTRSSLVERLQNGGSRAAYTYRVVGLSLSGEVRATDYVPNERIIWTMSGALQGTIRWYFAQSNTSHTRFTYAATYALPGPAVLHPVLTPLVRRYNERELARLLRNLKAELENRPSNV